MRVSRIRCVSQIIFFLFLMYGAYGGLRFRNFLPMWRCPHLKSFSEGCYLLPLQRFQHGLRIYPHHYPGMPFTGYVVMGGQIRTFLYFFLSLIIFIVLFNKLWCGWVCPFGTFQDGISFLRKKSGGRGIRFSERTKRILRPIKYIMLFVFLSTPIIFLSGFNIGYAPLFCQICPAKSILNTFEGNLLNLAVHFSSVTVASILTCIVVGITIVGISFKERFFCIFCPIAAFINIFNKFSILGLKKNVDSCDGCGNCWRACPMDIKELYLEKEKASILKEDCILCLRCIESCPQDNALSLRFFKKAIFSSARRYFQQIFQKKMKS